MPIKVGDQLPQVTFRVSTPDGVETRSTDDVFKGKTVVLFAVPGAFTPTCHKNHLPGYLEHAAAIKAKGVDTIAVTGVNDAFVMDAWAKATGGAGVIEFLSDGNADFAKAIGLYFDGSERGMGPRSQRYSMLVKDGVVQSLAVEGVPSRADVSGAAALLESLGG
jgi:peroxiredoxin